MKKYLIILVALLGFLVQSCDSYYSISLVNLSNDTIVVETNLPDTKNSKGEQFSGDFKYILNINQMVDIDTIGDKLMAKLGPGNIYYLYRRGGGSFHLERLCFSTMKIYTKTDTMVASDKKSIFDLSDNPEFKYNKDIDKGSTYQNSSTTRFILIRDKQ